MANSHRTATRPGCHYANFSCAPLLIATLATVASNQPAASQQNSAAAPKPAGTEIAPRGQREVKDIAYGDWKKLCFRPGAAKMICRTSITGTFATGQVAVRVDIVEPEGGGNARVQVFSPVGMYLPTPAKLTIDQGEPHSVPYTWCLTNACIAADVADPKLIKEMETGQSLQLEVVDTNALTVSTTVPISQFAAVRRATPTQTFEQNIDE